MRTVRTRPRLLVIGLGQYFHKLKSGIHENFRLKWLLDKRALETLNLTAPEAAHFCLLPNRLEDCIQANSFDCAMVLTPPKHHLEQFAALARFQKPTLVEKPLVTSIVETRSLSDTLASNPRLYCSDFYPDVRATALLTWMRPDLPTPLGEYLCVAGNEGLWQSGPHHFGSVTKIEGKILEGCGPEGTFDRNWLCDSVQGGVVFDLMYHYVALASYLFDQHLIATRVNLNTRLPSGGHVPWHRTIGMAETDALVEGHLSGGVPFKFEVGKYWEHVTVKWFKVHFTNGVAMMVFADPNVLRLKQGEKECQIQLKGNYYAHVATRFAKYVESRTDRPFGVPHAFRAVETCEKIKLSVR